MAHPFDEKAVIASLDSLLQQQRAAFAAACAERLLPAYLEFCRKSGKGDSRALGSVLTSLWDDLLGSTLTAADLREKLDACMALIPRD